MASVRKMRKMQKLPAALRELIPLAPVSTGVSAKPEAVITVTSVPMAHNVRPASIARAIMLKVVTSPRADRTVAMVAINRATVIRHAMAINPGRTAGANRATDRMPQRAEAMLCVQLSKKTDIYSFSLQSLEGQLPHLGAASINALRRELAAAIDAQAPGAVPLLNLRTSGVSAEAVSALLPVRVSAPGELMRSKYCIRHELGLCPKQCGKPAEDLVLVNNGRRFTVRFDCRNCEMVLI